MNLRRDLVVALVAMLVGWILLLTLISKWQRGRAGERVTNEPALIHYPGTEAVEEQTASTTGFRRYWFHLNEDYPSLSVYQFYKNKLEADGWKPVGQSPPVWVSRPDKNATSDLFRATWVDRKGLFQFDVEMVSTMTETKRAGGATSKDRKPGIDVYVTIRRVLLPGITFPQPETKPEGTPRGPEIQVK